MSVVVIGMEMPRVCIDGHHLGNCPIDRLWCSQRFAPKERDGWEIYKDRKDKLPDWCPLRPLPEKHGRLIDADKLEGAGYALARLHIDSDAQNPKQMIWRELIPFDEAPTVIEAEGE